MSFKFFNPQNLLLSAFFRIFGRSFNLERAAKVVISHESQKEHRDFFRFSIKIMAKFETIHERIKHLVDTKAGGKNTVFAQRLGVSEANIRGYIKKVIPKADVLEKIVISYEVNAMWLLTGLGYESLPNSEPGNPILATEDTNISTFFKQLDPYIQSKDAKIIQQAEEIGRLKETIRQLTIEKEKHVSDASTQNIANAG